MLSILIPIYNYNAYPLVKELHSQCLEATIDFEILCRDDFSSKYLQENQEINTLENCRFRNETNLGRGKHKYNHESIH
jgi:glycosyltransferase involved in cell wall biosynthesis